MPTEDFTIYGDWIYLNGSSTVLIEYKASIHYLQLRNLRVLSVPQDQCESHNDFMKFFSKNYILTTARPFVSDLAPRAPES